jgi:hypothetical protein
MKIYKIKQDISETNILLQEALLNGDIDRIFFYKEKLTFLIQEGLKSISHSLIQDYKGEIDD